MPLSPFKVIVGIDTWGNNTGTKGTLYIDDVLVKTGSVGLADPHVRLFVPDFRSRIGIKAVAILSGHTATDRIVATLTGNTGYSATVCNRSGPFDGRVDFPINLRGLPAATYTLTVRLLASGGGEKASASYSYTKPYEGDPTNYSIDEQNNITFQGAKLFPITCFALSHENVAPWYTNRYINLLMGMEWNNTPIGREGYQQYLNDVRAGQSNAMAVGPAHDYRFNREPNNDRWTPAAVLDYIQTLSNHPANAWWLWREEPDNWGYKANEVKNWWDLVKLNDPIHPNETLLMGYDYLPASGPGLMATMRSYHWPYLVADIYSWDIYPVENEASGTGFDAFAEAMDRSRRWNMDLLPVFPNIQTADCTPGSGGGTPTVTELLHMAWSMVVHGAKGVHWYHYQGATPPANFAAMTRFVDDTTALKEVILGDDVPTLASKQEQGTGRIDMAVKRSGRDVYLFAVNIKRQVETVNFTLGAGVTGTSAEVYGESRAIAISSGVFQDTFQPLTVHIYKIGSALAETTTTITAHTPNPSTPGQTVTVTFTVTSVAGTPAGDVTISDGIDTCSSTVAAGSCQIALRTGGQRSLTARYFGGGAFAASTSAAVIHTVAGDIILSVVKTGSGAGTVTSTPAGINCGSTCSASFTTGTVVTLAQTAAQGSVFTGWSGGCSGTTPCQVTMDEAKSVAANFNLQGQPTGYYPVTPCRIFDTREVDGLTAGAPLGAGSATAFPVTGVCDVPTTAKAIAANVTVVNGAALGEVEIVAGNLATTTTSTISVPLARARANNATIQLATNGAGTVLALNKTAGTVHLVLDVNGYFE